MKCPYCGETIDPKFQARLRALRTEQKMSQEKLSEITGIPRAQIANFETGRVRPSLDALIVIADQFDVSIDWLLGRT
jgi:transcriptional regulator with XRE-family HTH domain